MLYFIYRFLLSYYEEVKMRENCFKYAFVPPGETKIKRAGEKRLSKILDKL